MNYLLKLACEKTMILLEVLWTIYSKKECSGFSKLFKIMFKFTKATSHAKSWQQISPQADDVIFYSIFYECIVNNVLLGWQVSQSFMCITSASEDIYFWGCTILNMYDYVWVHTRGITVSCTMYTYGAQNISHN